MIRLTYSSMAAFLAHYRILRQAAEQQTLSRAERETLAAMQPLVETLTPSERAALGSASENRLGPEPGEEGRLRQRAEFKLRQHLLARGVLHD